MKSILFVLNGSRFFGINVFVLSDWYVYFVCGRLLTPDSIYQDIICDSTLCAVWVRDQNKIGTIRTAHPIWNLLFLHTHAKMKFVQINLLTTKVWTYCQKLLKIKTTLIKCKQLFPFSNLRNQMRSNDQNCTLVDFEDNSLFQYYAKCGYSSFIYP